MSHLLLARLCVAFLTTMGPPAPAPAAAGTDQAAQANNPATLQNESPAPTTPVAEATADASVPAPVPPVTAPAESSDPPAPEATSAAVPPSAAEQLPLGVPRGLFDVDPGGEAAGEAESALPTWLDPRRHEAARVIGALVLVLGLMVLCKVLVGRRGQTMLGGAGGRPSGVLEVLARYPVGRGQSLVLLKLARRVLLMHQAGATMTTLTEITDPEEVASVLGRLESGASGRASSWFRTLLRRYESEHERAEARGLSLEGRAGPAAAGGEVIDLTRGRRRPAKRGRRRSLAA